MNREIKFRICYTAQNGEKRIVYHDERFLIGLNGEIYENYGKDWNNPKWEIPFDNAEPLIIQQYTGCKDKNGKEIYEGDIVKCHRCFNRPFINDDIEIDYKWTEGDIEIGYVYWYDLGYKFCVSYEHLLYDDCEEFTGVKHRYEVIGNIFENKELLKYE